MTEEEEYRYAGITKEEAEKQSESWVEGIINGKSLRIGVVSDKVKLVFDLKKLLKKRKVSA